MRQFLILFDNIPIDKTSVRAGVNSPELITACRCINVGLFVSGNLRRDVTVSIALGSTDDLQIISFPGDTLRRVSPDERSISFFLLKALTILARLPLNTSKTMENNIIIQRTSFKEFLESTSSFSIVISDTDKQKQDPLDLKRTDVLLFYDNRETPISLRSLGLLQYHVSPRPSHPERFILDINREADRTR